MPPRRIASQPIWDINAVFNRRRAIAQAARTAQRRPRSTHPRAIDNTSGAAEQCLLVGKRRRVKNYSGGERGIRTLDTGFGPYAPLAGECLRPLGHLSG